MAALWAWGMGAVAFPGTLARPRRFWEAKAASPQKSATDGAASLPIDFDGRYRADV